MNSTFITIVLAFVIVGSLMVFQATRSGASPVMLPSEVIKRGPEANIPRVRVAGRVSKDDISYETSPSAQLKFRVEDPTHPEHGSIPVVYNNLRPDMFTAGRDVIIDGEYTGGVVQASSLLTQCPSKYEPPSPDKAMQLDKSKMAN